MLYGIDRISSIKLEGRVGLITSGAARDRNFRSSIDVLKEHGNLAALFAPEHGIRGEHAAGAKVEDAPDGPTGLPVYSLYGGDGRHMREELLAKIDCLAYDVPDIGARFYTFISTLLYAMEDCAKAGIPVVVFDRPNPLGDMVEGGLLREEHKSFVGAYPLTMRYGLTCGEFAKMANQELNLGCDLTVVPCEGWRRDMLFPETNRPWFPPSPNIPRFESALLYPGMCLVEGTSLSEGRGTTLPFEQIGAPHIDAVMLAEIMESQNISGARFVPVWFTPSDSKHKGQLCGGVQTHIINPNTFAAVEVGVRLLLTIKKLFGFEYLKNEDDRYKIDLLSGSDVFTAEEMDADQILRQFKEESAAFMERKIEFHLYE